MNWADERYVRLYTRDTVDWLALSFDAQALLALLLRKVDRSGVLELGRHGRKSVAISLGHPGEWDRLEPALAELEADGCVEVQDDALLVVKNFIEAQEAIASDARRAREFRERRRRSVTKRDGSSRIVTERHEELDVVTERHATVTPPFRASLPCLPSKNPAGAREVQLTGQKALPEPEPDREEPPPHDDSHVWNGAATGPRPRTNGRPQQFAYGSAQVALGSVGRSNTCTRCGAQEGPRVYEGRDVLCNPCRFGGAA